MGDAENRRLARAERPHQQVHVIGGDALQRHAGLAPVPGSCGVAQPKQRERRHASVEIGPELSAIDRLLDDALDQALVLELQQANALASGRGQEAALAQKYQRVVEPLGHWGEMLEHELRYLLRAAALLP